MRIVANFRALARTSVGFLVAQMVRNNGSYLTPQSSEGRDQNSGKARADVGGAAARGGRATNRSDLSNRGQKAWARGQQKRIRGSRAGRKGSAKRPNDSVVSVQWGNEEIGRKSLFAGGWLA